MKLDGEVGRYLSWWRSEPTPAENFFLKGEPCPVNLLSGSYRGSKTVAAAKFGLLHTLLFNGSNLGIFRLNKTDLRTSTFKTLLWLTDPRWVQDLDNSNLCLTLINGSRIYSFGASDVAKLGSIELSCALVDEASQVPPEVFGQIVGRLSGTITRPPNYDDLPAEYRKWIDAWLDHRPCQLATNPEGPSHWIFGTFFDPDTLNPSYRATTTNSIDNPHLPKSYLRENLIKQFLRRPKSHTDAVIDGWIDDIRSGKKTIKDILHHFNVEGKRKVAGVWVGSDSSIYEFDPQVQEIKEKDIPKETETTIRIMGLDFGFHNPRIVVIQCDQEEYQWKFTVLDYAAPAKLTNSSFVAEVVKLAEKWDVSTIYHPHDQPSIVAEIAENFKGYMERAKMSVLPGIVAVQNIITSGRFEYVARETRGYSLFKAEMAGYGWKLSKDGQRLDEPIKLDDHFPDAFRVAVYTFESRNRLEKPMEDSRDQVVYYLPTTNSSRRGHLRAI